MGIDDSSSADDAIDLEKDPFAYNRDLDVTDSAAFSALFRMRPTHISEGDWQYQVGRLKLLLEAAENAHGKAMVILGWKSQNGLLPNK